MSTDFETATASMRDELLAHCYRMMGCVVDAEHQVQETYLRARRAFHDFEGRSSVRTRMYRIATNATLNALAWTAALQDLSTNQRAVVLLRDVLGFSATEVAETLDPTTASVNSALQRGRGTMGGGLPEPEPGVDEETEIAAFEAFVEAFERHDFDAVVAALADEATWQMPPFDRWYCSGLAGLPTVLDHSQQPPGTRDH